ncbi:MAG: calcium-binding protein [Actinomycetota bacterium]
MFYRLVRGFIVPVFVTALVAVPQQALAGTPTCKGKRATMVGTRGDDRLTATKGRDVIVARDGADRILNIGADDLVCAGPGRDTSERYGRVYGGPGNDHLSNAGYVYGGPGDDLLDGGGRVYGGGGNDHLIGNAGYSFNPYADYGSDALHGGLGNDRIVGVTSSDENGDHEDYASYSDATNSVRIDVRANVATGWGRDTFRNIDEYHGSIYDDVLLGGGDGETFRGFRGDDLIRGRGTGDWIWGDDGNDTLIGGGGDDRFEGAGGAGNDLIEGGRGRELLDLRGSPAVEVNLRRGTISGQGDDEIRGVEDVWGSARDDVIIGTGGRNNLLGYIGADRILGRGGNDTLNGYDGRDYLDGGTGDDWCRGERRVRCERPVD